MQRAGLLAASPPRLQRGSGSRADLRRLDCRAGYQAARKPRRGTGSRASPVRCGLQRGTGSGASPARCPGWRMGERPKHPGAQRIVRLHAPRAGAPSSAGAAQVVCPAHALCAQMTGRQAARRPPRPVKPSLSWPARGYPGRRPRRPSRPPRPGGARRSVRRRTPRIREDPSSRCRRRPWARRLPGSSRRCRAADVARRSRPPADPRPESESEPVLLPRRRRVAGSPRSLPRVGPREPRVAPRRAAATRCARCGRRRGRPRRRAPSIRCRP